MGLLRWLGIGAEKAAPVAAMPAPMPSVGPSERGAGHEALRHFERLRERLAGIIRQRELRPVLRARAYEVPEPIPGVLPQNAPKRGSLAMDSAISNAYSFASQAQWSGAGFMGYPLLAELTQIPEFRSPCAQLANDMTRQWGRVVSTSDQGKDKAIAEKIAAIEAELKRLNAQEAFRWAFEQDNQFGRSQIFLDLGESSGAELTKPLDARIKIKKGGLKGIVPVETYWTYPANYNTTNPLKSDFYRAKSWYAMGQEVHASRLLIFNSRPVSDILKPAYLFGGISLIQLMWVCVENWLRTRQSVSDLINAYSIMVLQTDMAQDITDAGADRLIARAQVFNDFRSNMGLMITSKSTEDFKNVSAPIGALDKLQAQSQEHMSAIALIPLVVMFGITPTGLNSSSEGELQIYDGNIKSIQERVGTPNMQTLLQCVQMSLFEEIDDTISWAWNPLRQLTGKEQSELRKAEAESDAVLLDHGVVSPLEVRQKLAADKDGPWSALDVDDLPEQSDPAEEGDPLHDHDLDETGETAISHAADMALDDDWNESAHPRAENGQFGSGGSSAHAGPVGTGAVPHAGVRGGVDKGEAASIRHYTETGFKSINWGLRGIRQHTPESAAHLTELDRVMSRASLPEPMTVYRGIGGNGLKEILKHGLKKGAVIPDPGFLSTSKNSGVGKSFQNSKDNIMLEIRLPKGSRAVDLGRLSDNPGEQEVLLDRNSKLEVVSFNSKTKTAVMELVQ